MPTTGGSVAAMIFWMKARAGWREKHEVVVSEAASDYMPKEDEAEIIARIKSKLAEWERDPWAPTITAAHSDGSAAPALSTDSPCSPPTNDR